MYRVLIIIMALLLSGCGTKKSGTDTETSANVSSGKSDESENVKETAAPAGEGSVTSENENESMQKDGASDLVIFPDTENEYNRMASDAYRNILKSDFPNGGYYCIVDMNGDNVYELAATSKEPDEKGQYLSIVAYVDKKHEEVEYTVIDTDEPIGFDIGYKDETGKLLVRTGNEAVHHYAFQVKEDSLEKSDFLVLDRIMDSVDKTKDPENYQKYINQDRGYFNPLLMWTITDEHLSRDLSDYVSATPKYFDAIDTYLRAQPKGKVYGFYRKDIEEVFSMDFLEIEKRFGAPAARILNCSVKRDKASDTKHLQFEESFLFCSGGIGCYVLKDHTVKGTMDTFFDVRQEVYTFKELQDTLGVPFYHDSSTSDYDIVFVYMGHTFHVAASDMEKGLIDRGSHTKTLKNALDTGSMQLLYDSDGNITENHN